MSLNKIVKTNSKKGMRMKKLDIDELRSIAAKTSVHEKRLLRTCLIIVLFGLLFALLIICFINDEWFTLNQMTFL